jgi:hypothetical protein
VILARVNIVCAKVSQIAEAQFAVETKFYKVTSSICVAVLAPGILRWILDFFFLICAHLVSVMFL